jgi:hypothetical protein
MPEEPIHALITGRFELGFIVELPNGQSGQLRVPEMSRSTAEWDRSTDQKAGIGSTVAVYVVRQNDGDNFFSEFTAEERSERDKRREDWIKALNEATVGQTLEVRVERKLEWGCICRQQAEPFLEGVLATQETVTQNRLPTQCATRSADWEQLAEGTTVPVAITHKQWAHWRYMLYFSLSGQPNG